MINPKFTVASVASIAAAGLFMGGVAAHAADLGGNCCADLEERVAELEATTARKGNRKMSLTVYGQVHAAMFFHNIDEADRPKKSVIDGAQSQTRFGFRGEARINSDVAAGFVLEIGVGGFESILESKTPGASTSDLSRRLAYVHITSKSLGSLSLGTQSLATDGVAEMDLGETGVASVPLSLAPADSALIGVSLSPFDGGRADSIKYTTPTVGGFQLSAAWASDDAYDVALRYAGEFGSIRIAAGAGYREDNGPLGLVADTKTMTGSASIMHTTSGIFISGSYGKQDLAALGNLEAYAVRGGISKKINALGRTAIYVEYGQIRDIISLPNTPTVIGAGLIQSIDPAAMDLYVSWKQYDDDDLIGLGTQNVFLAGARIKF